MYQYHWACNGMRNEQYKENFHGTCCMWLRGMKAWYRYTICEHDNTRVAYCTAYYVSGFWVHAALLFGSKGYSSSRSEKTRATSGHPSPPPPSSHPAPLLKKCQTHFKNSIPKRHCAPCPFRVCTSLSKIRVREWQ